MLHMPLITTHATQRIVANGCCLRIIRRIFDVCVLHLLKGYLWDNPIVVFTPVPLIFDIKTFKCWIKSSNINGTENS